MSTEDKVSEEIEYIIAKANLDLYSADDIDKIREWVAYELGLNLDDSRISDGIEALKAGLRESHEAGE